MSDSRRPILRVGLLLLVCAVLQLAFASGWTVGGSQPNVVLLAAALAALHFGSAGAAAAGFSAGLLTACIASPPNGGFGSLIVSSTLSCYLVGRMEGHLFRDNPAVAIALAILQVALAQILFFIFDPQPAFGHWLRTAGLSVLFDAVLAIPFYFAVRRLLRGIEPEGAF